MLRVPFLAKNRATANDRSSAARCDGESPNTLYLQQKAETGPELYKKTKKDMKIRLYYILCSPILCPKRRLIRAIWTRESVSTVSSIASANLIKTPHKIHHPKPTVKHDKKKKNEQHSPLSEGHLFAYT